MKIIKDAQHDPAVANLLSRIKNGTRLPNNVFEREWDDYLFFESYVMFEERFIEVKNVVLDTEGLCKISLINIGNSPIESRLELQLLLLDRKTSYPEYASVLRGDGSPLNWIFLMDRYVCASGSDDWCIYCEKENDIAVLAVRDEFPTPTLQVLRYLLKADSIKTVNDPRLEHLFNFDKLVPSWKSALLAGYGRR